MYPVIQADYTTMAVQLQDISDPRQKRGRSYEWQYLLLIVASAVMAGEQSVRGMEQWATEQAATLLECLQPRRQRIPSAGQQTSIVKKLSRLLQNGALCVREWYNPVAQALLQEVVGSGQAVRLVIDGTKVGGGHRLLMVAVAYRRRSLPIAWT
jgi:hypothetical protein